MSQRYAAVQHILRASQTAIRQHGFTQEAIRAANVSLDDQTFNNYFPTAQDAAQQLLTTFDRIGLEQADDALKGPKQIELLLVGKLLHSEPYRDQLTEALARLTASGSLLRNLPSPSPVLTRSWSIVDEAIHLAGHNGNWYSSRLRLTNAFTLAELHMLRPEYDGDVHASLRLFRKLARNNVVLPDKLPDAGAWINWGARGWLGIFRSVGL